MPEPDAQPDLDAELALLSQTAREVGQIAMRWWGNSPKAWEKGDNAGPVSEADLEVNRAIHARLGAARPGYGWLSEESPDDPARLSHERVFIVDPIDGTRAFLAGTRDFAITLALAQGERIVAGVVHLPARELMYAAHATGPALCNGQVIHPSRRSRLEGGDLLATATTMAPENWPGGLPDTRRSHRASLAWRFCLVAEGRHDGMVTLRDTWEWDACAGTLIAERAGACVSDRHGRGLCFNQPHPQVRGVVVAPPALHAQLLAGLGAQSAA